MLLSAPAGFDRRNRRWRDRRSRSHTPRGLGQERLRTVPRRSRRGPRVPLTSDDTPLSEDEGVQPHAVASSYTVGGRGTG